MILDLGSFIRRGLIDGGPCELCRNLGGNKAWREQRVQDQKGGGRRQRDHRPVCNGKVTNP